jgi:hypothetical protein
VGLLVFVVGNTFSLTVKLVLAWCHNHTHVILGAEASFLYCFQEAIQPRISQAFEKQKGGSLE